MTEQPEYITPGGELKDFQMTGLNWLAYLWSQGENGILADEVRTLVLIPRRAKVTDLLGAVTDGPRQDCADRCIPLLPLPLASPVWPIPRCCPTVDAASLDDAIRTVVA